MHLNELLRPSGHSDCDRDRLFNDLREALLNDRYFDIQRLYELNYTEFCEVLEALREWRTQQFFYQTLQNSK
jgi:hypothetical protein